MQLSERDFAILQSVAEHHFMTTGQIEAIHFGSHAPEVGARLARRVLARLRRHRLLGALQRRIGGVRAGSAGIVHYLDHIGHRLLSDGTNNRTRGFREPSPRFIDHHLAIAEAHVTLIRADRDRQIELTECVIEPTSWRQFTGTGGSRLSVKPDLYIETATTPGSDLVTAWFLEIDLGTEGIQTLLKKCRNYQTYRQSGIEQDRHGSFPLVIWSMTHPDPAKAQRRRHALTKAIAADRNLPDALFRIIAPEQLLPLLQPEAAS
ncbi:replication-relaxation family protein [Mycobacteroides abscessus]|uniref:replication-relaxation family protein n=1 Tax=Mycobacteroides abscessus TaxID=36809 RepID=UPI001F45C80B|nr:replication-relaxation family protein [Mycobacteroides abscessus]